MSAWIITAKDLRLLVRDRRTIAVLLALPLAFIVIIGLTTGKFMRWTNTSHQLKIAVVDQIDYASIGSSEFMTEPLIADEEGFEGDSEFQAAPEPALPEEDRAYHRRLARNLMVKIINRMQEQQGVRVLSVNNWRKELAGLKGTTYVEGDLEAATDMAASGDVDATVVFCPEFYEKVFRLSPGVFLRPSDDAGLSNWPEAVGVDLLGGAGGPDSSVKAFVVLSLFNELPRVVACNTGGIVGRSASEECDELQAETNGESIRLLPPQDLTGPFDTEDGVYNDIVPSYTVMFVFFLVNIMARSFLHERELGTLRRLRVAPIRPVSLLFGKTVPFFIISLCQTSLLFLVGRVLFGMSWGAEPWLLVPVIVSTSMAATALGLMVATLIKTDAQVSAYATSAVIILAGISGCFMPRKWLPDLMQQISLGTPHAWALIAYDGILNDPTPDMALIGRCCGVLVSFAVVFFALGAMRFESVE
ncbi:ABC transporter permease [Stratiformator vulcanicus]|uniref:ABC-2 family transporter protein n=1 Tax=Stratiformator vulcanicus TaxID=2527980 RepID=A0A517R5K3_9PLAN|nr:ABC transporter permease [Stratiformator vulcanicus]QDT39113.1 ABC-2 family transporter protein [Stratiformator vulcanicus]